MNNDHPDGELRRYVVITQDLLGASDLNANEKLVLAYISSYDEFYASNASTGEFLGLSERIVERAKQKLTRLDYIRIIKQTGRGNIYSFNLLRLAKNGGADSPKLADQTSQKWRTEIKEEIKKKSKGDESPAESKSYGREDINEIIELWEAETGVSIKGDTSQRRQVYNLIRKHGADATKALVRRVGAMRRLHDQFAPQILTPGDLTGKYSKLPRLEAWEERHKEQQPQVVMMPKRFEPEPEHEISDEERAAVAQRFKEARENLPFLKKGSAK